jgi:hypothetical protein
VELQGHAFGAPVPRTDGVDAQHAAVRTRSDLPEILDARSGGRHQASLFVEDEDRLAGAQQGGRTVHRVDSAAAGREDRRGVRRTRRRVLSGAPLLRFLEFPELDARPLTGRQRHRTHGGEREHADGEQQPGLEARDPRPQQGGTPDHERSARIAAPGPARASFAGS